MKNPCIWESASRPLFVRTVWLEGTQLRPGFQRHFLLDYDTNRPLERLNSALNPLQPKRKGLLFHFNKLQEILIYFLFQRILKTFLIF